MQSNGKLEAQQEKAMAPKGRVRKGFFFELISLSIKELKQKESQTP
jgi:hypothetical protein